MKRGIAFLGATLLVAVLLPLHLAPPTAASGTSYSFNLIGPGTAKAEDGSSIRVTGSGSFDTGGAGSVVASGSFTMFSSAGAVVERGTWSATAFSSFDAFGGPSSGIQGGVLEITVTLFPDGGAPVTGVPMSVTCLVNKPAGFTGEEGTSVDGFTEHTGGNTLFHLNN